MAQKKEVLKSVAAPLRNWVAEPCYKSWILGAQKGLTNYFYISLMPHKYVHVCVVIKHV
jgi:hypothetical protein